MVHRLSCFLHTKIMDSGDQDSLYNHSRYIVRASLWPGLPFCRTKNVNLISAEIVMRPLMTARSPDQTPAINLREFPQWKTICSFYIKQCDEAPLSGVNQHQINRQKVHLLICRTTRKSLRADDFHWFVLHRTTFLTLAADDFYWFGMHRPTLYDELSDEVTTFLLLRPNNIDDLSDEATTFLLFRPTNNYKLSDEAALFLLFRPTNNDRKIIVFIERVVSEFVERFFLYPILLSCMILSDFKKIQYSAPFRSYFISSEFYLISQGMSSTPLLQI